VFVGGTIHLAMAEAAYGRGDQKTAAGHLADAHATFKQLKAPIWAARAEALAQREGVVLEGVGER